MVFPALSRALPVAGRGTFSVATSTARRRAYHASNSTIPCLHAQRPQRKASGLVSKLQTRSATTQHAIANPELAGIEKRWEGMPPQEQAELWMKLRDRMKVDWHDMTVQEKKAAYWIAFGPHGPRAETPKGEGIAVFVQTAKYVLIAAVVFFGIRAFANPMPKTMTKEWQEATNEYAKREKMDPITGVSSEGYTGKGHVQSPPASKQ